MRGAYIRVLMVWVVVLAALYALGAPITSRDDREEGVLVPAANAARLVLRDDVVAAAAEGRFRIFAVDTVDEGIELLTGLPAGAPDHSHDHDQAEPAQRREHRGARADDDPGLAARDALAAAAQPPRRPRACRPAAGAPSASAGTVKSVATVRMSGNSAAGAAAVVCAASHGKTFAAHCAPCSRRPGPLK